MIRCLMQVIRIQVADFGGRRFVVLHVPGGIAACCGFTVVFFNDLRLTDGQLADLSGALFLVVGTGFFRYYAVSL